MINRRVFLKSGALAVVSFGLSGTPLFIPRAAAASLGVHSRRKKILVCIFQRGAMDGLMAVTPFSDPFLPKHRPRLFMNVSAGKEGSLIDLDGKFALHPSLSGFESLFREKRLAIVHGMGSPDKTRSHFDAQDYMENGTPGRKGTASGWLNRTMDLLPAEKNLSPFRAVALTTALPKSLYGDNPALAVAKLDDFGVKTGSTKVTANAGKSFEALYEQTSQKILRGTGHESFDAVKILSNANLKSYTPNAGVEYPNSPLGSSLKQIAQLIKANVGLEIAFAETGGWDTHVQQGTVNGTFAQRSRDLSSATTAFWKDVEPLQDDVVLMTMTEFGRTVRENGSGGTDHGRGSCMFIMGNAVSGGKVYGQMPELSPENLEDGRDVPVTTDFRSVFAEVAGKHLNINKDSVVFPDWKGKRLTLL